MTYTLTHGQAFLLFVVLFIISVFAVRGAIR